MALITMYQLIYLLIYEMLIKVNTARTQKFNISTNGWINSKRGRITVANKLKLILLLI